MFLELLNLTNELDKWILCTKTYKYIWQSNYKSFFSQIWITITISNPQSLHRWVEHGYKISTKRRIRSPSQWTDQRTRIAGRLENRQEFEYFAYQIASWLCCSGPYQADTFGQTVCKPNHDKTNCQLTLEINYYTVSKLSLEEFTSNVLDHELEHCRAYLKMFPLTRQQKMKGKI